MIRAILLILHLIEIIDFSSKNFRKTRFFNLVGKTILSVEKHVCTLIFIPPTDVDDYVPRFLELAPRLGVICI